MAAWSGVTAQTATDTKLPADMREWFEKSDYDDYSNVAMVSSTEDRCENVFVAPISTAKVATPLATGIGLVKLEKFWMACRDLLEESRKPKRDIDSNTEAPIPNEEAVDIATKWFDKHGYVLPNSHLLVPNQQGKMWREFEASPEHVDGLANKLRPRSVLEKTAGNQLAILPGQTVMALEVIADEILRSFDLFIRARAFFMMLSFVSITKPLWFPLQAA